MMSLDHCASAAVAAAFPVVERPSDGDDLTRKLFNHLMITQYYGWYVRCRSAVDFKESSEVPWRLVDI